MVAIGAKLARTKTLREYTKQKGGLISKLSWILEIIDIVKDWIYIFMFNHGWGALIVLLISVTLPFGIIDMFGAG